MAEKKDEDEKIIERAYSKVSKKQFTAASSSGTTHLKRHLEKCPTRISGRVNSHQTTLNFKLEGIHDIFTYDQQRARELHATYIASAQLSLRLAEDSIFEEYIHEAYNPQFREVATVQQ